MKKLLITAFIASLLGTGLLQAIDPENNISTIEFFPDLEQSSLEGQAAANLRQRGIISGRPDGNFDGNASVNRAEIAKFLLLAKGIEVDNMQNNGKFPDILEGEWYVKYVIKAHQLGILNGYPDGNFLPARTVNTAEFLKLATKTFDLPENLPHTFTDVPAGEWYAPYAGIVAEYGLFPQRSTTQLNPAQELTRNEVAIAIYRITRPKEYQDFISGRTTTATQNTSNINAYTTNTLPIISQVIAGKTSTAVMDLRVTPNKNVTLKKLIFEVSDKDFFDNIWIGSESKVSVNRTDITLTPSQILSQNVSKILPLYADISKNKARGDSAKITLKKIEWEIDGKTESKEVSVEGYQMMIQ